ncbi:MAG TPA: HAMP domain-containing sensor histidine kinase, partial [Candidatus Binatia bacterium]
KITELEEANKVKDEFLSVMSHELRTPLNVIMGYTAMIKDEMLGGVNSEQRRALDKVMTRSNDLLTMITSILYATSIEAKEVRVDNSNFALADLLDEIKRANELSLIKPIRLKWEYPADLPAVVSDREKVRVILQKVIENATKFTEKGCVTISARVVETGLKGEAQQWLEFTVADTGVGIAKEKLPIIFEKFRQADSSETRRYGGIGLGLYIAKHFTELLGGKIEVETEEGKGSVFTIKAPCAASSSPPASPRREIQEARGQAQPLH